MNDNEKLVLWGILVVLLLIKIERDVYKRQPTDHTELNCNPLVTALSNMNTAVAPELEIKSTPCGCSCGMGWLNTL